MECFHPKNMMCQIGNRLAVTPREFNNQVSIRQLYLKYYDYAGAIPGQGIMFLYNARARIGSTISSNCLNIAPKQAIHIAPDR